MNSTFLGFLSVSVCVHTRLHDWTARWQVEHQPLAQENHNILSKSTKWAPCSYRIIALWFFKSLTNLVFFNTDLSFDVFQISNDFQCFFLVTPPLSSSALVLPSLSSLSGPGIFLNFEKRTSFFRKPCSCLLRKSWPTDWLIKQQVIQQTHRPTDQPTDGQSVHCGVTLPIGHKFFFKAYL